jgi:tRNA (cytidine/uridine-2'-O-)-methyltransferase
MNDQSQAPYFRIVLVEPEIPQNTGNIGRTCVATSSELHLVGPMAFEISDKQLKRAGLDYWPNLKWFYYENFEEWWKKVEDPSRVFYLTTKTKKRYTDVKFQKGDWLVFGKETKGLDPQLIQRNIEQALTIPMLGPARSLNLATSVAIVAYEGIRQLVESNSPNH